MPTSKRSHRRGLYIFLIALLLLTVFSVVFYATQIMPGSARQLSETLTQQAIEHGN